MRKLAMSVTSWFCVPEFGMKDFEVLCRASAFLVRTKGWNPANSPKNMKRPNFHVLTVSHGVAPWKWPKLYPDDWLKHVNEKHTHYTVEMRYEDGIMINQGDLLPKVYHHPTRDLAAMHIEFEDEIAELYMELNLETELDILGTQSSQYPLQVGQALEFHGHDVVIPFGDDRTLLKADNPADYADESKYDRRVLPTIINGKVQGKTAKQLFCTTHPVILPVGMCGGPVVIDRVFTPLPPQSRLAPEFDEQGRRKRGVPVSLSNPTKARIEGLKAKHAHTQDGTAAGGAAGDATTTAAAEPAEEEGHLKFGKSSKLVCGLLEGIVPVDHPVEEIRGSAVFVEGPDIISFLKEVEDGNVKPVQGGEAFEFVGNDLDPTKMSLKNI